jgi:membrane-associated phospholipid phosphatase
VTSRAAVPQMVVLPTRLDLWLATALSGFLRFHPKFNAGVQRAIQHNISGGFWFGATLFARWIHAAGSGQREVRLRTINLLIGSALAVLLVLLAGVVVSRPPPGRYPALAYLFPGYPKGNPNTNCFPSESTALYGSIAAGVHSLHKVSGWIPWLFVVSCVGFPRMYVGRHRVIDVLVGLLLALVGYACAWRLLETRVTLKIEPFFGKRPRLQLIREFLVFVWMLQVTVEFRDIVWIKQVVELLIS